MTGNDSVMLNPEQQRLVLKAIANGPRPLATLRVWSQGDSEKLTDFA
jgi:hypothetical protein